MATDGSSTLSDSPSSLCPRRMLLVVGAVAVVVRLLYFLEHLGSLFFALPLLDQKYYDAFARALLSGQGVEQFAGFRPVLYPQFLAVHYWIGGDGGMVLAYLSQHALGVAMALMVAIFAWKLFGEVRAGLVAGIIFALAGPPLYFEGELLITTLMSFLFLLTVGLMVASCRWEGKKAVLGWLASGAMLSLAAQARPNVLVLLPVYLLVAGWIYWSSKEKRSFLPLVAFVGVLVVQSGFGMINARYTGKFQLLTSAGGINLYLGNNRNADGMIPRQGASVTYTGDYRDSVQVYAEQEYRRAMEDLGEVVSDDPSEVSSYWVKRTREDIGEAPGAWCWLMAKKTWLMFWNHEVANNKSYQFVSTQESTVLRVLPIRWWVLMGMLPFGVLCLWRKGVKIELLVLLSCLSLYAFGIVLFFVNSRFRIPLWPILAVFSGGGCCLLYDSIRTSEAKGINKYFLMFAAVGGLSFLNVFRVPGDDLSRDFFFRSVAAWESGRFEEAMQDAKIAARLDPSNMDIIFHLGNVAFSRDDFETALQLWQVVQESDPTEPRVYNNIGAVLEAQGRYGEALDSYLKAVEVAPGYAKSLQYAVMLELRAGRWEDAKGHLEAALELEGQTTENLILQGLLAISEGDTAKVAGFMEKAQEQNPGMVERMVEEYRQRIVIKDQLEEEQE